MSNICQELEVTRSHSLVFTDNLGKAGYPDFDLVRFWQEQQGLHFPGMDLSLSSSFSLARDKGEQDIVRSQEPEVAGE